MYCIGYDFLVSAVFLNSQQRCLFLRLVLHLCGTLGASRSRSVALCVGPWPFLPVSSVAQGRDFLSGVVVDPGDGESHAFPCSSRGLEVLPHRARFQEVLLSSQLAVRSNRVVWRSLARVGAGTLPEFTGSQAHISEQQCGVEFTGHLCVQRADRKGDHLRC